MIVPRVVTIAVCSLFCCLAFAGEVAIDVPDSVVAVVTHKGGFAKGMAHNHLVIATGYQVRLGIDPEAPREADFELSLATESLEVDPWESQQVWYPRLAALEILDEPFEELSEKKRAKIRRSMLGEKQLDAEEHPGIRVRVVSIAERASTAGAVSFPYAIQVALTVRGKTVQRAAAGRVETDGGHVTVEAVGTFQFTDFGIEPFSALLGAVRNQDEFHIYLHLRGTVTEEEADDESAGAGGSVTGGR